MKRSLVVLRKELRDGVRDRRALLSVLLYPLVGPAIVTLTLNLVSDHEMAANGLLSVPIVGVENAPGLVHFLKDHGVDAALPTDDPEQAVRRGEYEVVLRIPSDYGARFRSGMPAPLDLIVDRSRQEQRGDAARLRALLQAYSAGIGAERLLVRGVHPEVAQAVDVRELDVATPKQRAALILGMIPVFLLLGSFVGGMNIATDATSGERERGSLEPLLLNPLPRQAIVLGKWLATSLFAFSALSLTLFFTVAALAWVPGVSLGIHLVLGASECLQVLVAALPLCGFFAALQLCVATFARSYKEAQAYLSFLVFVPMLPGLFISLKNISSAFWLLAIPGFGQQLLIRDIMRSGSTGIGQLLFSALCSAACTAALLRVTARLFQKERIIFGR